MMRYIYGLDMASQDDFQSFVIHGIPEIEDKIQPLPELKFLWGTQHTSYDKSLAFLQQKLFRKFPPWYIVTDYTNEKTFTDLLIAAYGKQIVEAINLGAGTSGTKKMLKDDGKSIFKQGYRLPNPSEVSDPALREFLIQLMGELQREQMMLTPGGRLTFDHPRNKHNDLAIGWELSIHGCMKFIHSILSDVVIEEGDYNTTPYDEDGISDLPGPENIDEPFPELKGKRGIKITGQWRQDSSVY